ncbi:hypothetical protein [Pontibacter chitinilyticus]|uniref:hypothetical protein n=1 Tax=Pontibacter chitinilyticus TaxID=2674989 RepID=UPI0032199247
MTTAIVSIIVALTTLLNPGTSKDTKKSSKDSETTQTVTTLGGTTTWNENNN